MKFIFSLSVNLLFLFSVLQAQVAVTSGGAGAPAGSGVNGANNKGLPATGLGCGGGGGSWWGGSGGAGKFGGGGGGAGGYFSLGNINWAGGDGGQGVVVIAYYNGASQTSATVLISGTSVTVPAGVTSAKVWAIGGGGGGGGATQSDGTSGGSGAAGGVAFITKAVVPGNSITYSLGAGGRGGHGTIIGTAGGTTSATIAGSTIYGYGGGAGIYNNTTNTAGGGFAGGDGGANGGAGYGRTGDVGGGGGAAIGAVAGTQQGNDGGTGASSADVSGLFAACAIATTTAVPFITSFSPTAGLTGTTVIITGGGFTGASAVYIGGVAASSFTVDSDSQISAVVSGSSVTGSVSVTCSFVTVSLPIYFFTAPVAPTISTFSPVSAQRGQVVTISGNKFLGVTNVSFGGTAAASFTINSDFQIVATVNTGTTGAVSVTSSSGTGTLAGFTWLSTTQTSAITFSSVQSGQMTINWTNGNADKRVVFVQEGNGTATDPVDNVTYMASTNWLSKGTQLGSSGFYCVFNGTGSTVTITGLSPGTMYKVIAYEYNGAAGAEKYQLAAGSNNPNTQVTLGILPLKWISFTGQDLQGSTILTWVTAEEHNTDHFLVQCSTDAQQWVTLGTVRAVTGNGLSTYRYSHQYSVAGYRYYRIGQYDVDGRYSYSPVVLLSANKPFRLAVNNPVTDGRLYLSVTDPGTVHLYSTGGALMYAGITGAGVQSIDVSRMPPGIYILRAGNWREKVIIE